MKLLRGSDNDLFLSGSTNISDDDSISETSVSAEFEVAPYCFVPELSAESAMKRPQQEGRSWLIGWFKPRTGWKYTNWPHCTRLKTFGWVDIPSSSLSKVNTDLRIQSSPP